MAICYARASCVFQDPKPLVVWMDPAGTLGLLQGLALGAGASPGPAGSPRESRFPCLCLHPLSKLHPPRVCPCPSLRPCRGSGAWAMWDRSLFFRLHGWSGGLYRARTQGLGEQCHHLTAGSGWRGCVGALPLGTRPSVGPGSAPARC